MLAVDGAAIDFPGALLPKGSRVGDILTLSIEHDTEATRRLAEDTRRVQAELKKRDTDEDIKL